VLDFIVREIGGPDDHEHRVFLVPDAPSGIRELCNAEAIARLKNEGVEYLHFGLTPFIIDGEEGQGPASNPMVSRLIRGLCRDGQKIQARESQWTSQGSLSLAGPL
jgi:hypothetical protein